MKSPVLKIIKQGSNSNNYVSDNENIIVYSKVRQIENHIKDRGLSIKYVISGKENYFIDNRKYSVTSGKYLIINRNHDYLCNINSDFEVEGICLFFDKKLVNDIYYVLQSKDSDLLNNPFGTHPKQIEFIEKIYSENNDALASFLYSFAHSIRNSKNQNFNLNEIITQCAEHLILSQNKVFDYINNVTSVKSSTKKELFKRISRAKEFIDDNFSVKINIADISSEAFLSEFHFIRTFKQIYRISPHKYIINKRLTKAHKLIHKKTNSISEIAFLSGFADIYSFSKTFKKYYGFCPSSIIKQQ